MVRKGLRVGMEPSTASEEEKGSERAKGERRRKRKKKKTQSNRKDIRMKTWRRLDHAETLTLTHRHRGGMYYLPMVWIVRAQTAWMAERCCLNQTGHSPSSRC